MNAFDVLGQGGNYTTSTGSTSATGLRSPSAVAVDTVNHRLFANNNFDPYILVYNLDVNNVLIDRTADFALNAPNTGGPDYGASYYFDNVDAMAYDPTGNRLFVADSSSSQNRVLVYDVASITNGEAPVNVLGQPNLSTFTFPSSTTALNMRPRGLAFDDARDLLFVSDPRFSSGGGMRVLVFNVASITNGEAAVNVLGQSNFTSNGADAQNAGAGCTTTPNACGVSQPGALAYDPANQRLFLNDGGNSRVLAFDVSTITDHEAATKVLGQASFTDGSAHTASQSQFGSLSGLAYDNAHQRLFLAGGSDNRTLMFDVTAITNGEAAVNIIGQANFTATGAATTQSGQSGPDEVAYGSNDVLYVIDSTNNRVLLYDAAVGDTTAPVISSVASGSISSTRATITWTTDESSDSKVNYGLTASYGTSAANTSMATSHTVYLTGLKPSTLYHYRACSKDAALNSACSGDLTFTTSAGGVGNGSVSSTVKIDDSTANGPVLSDGESYGKVASIGDLNNDGVPDLAVGRFFVFVPPRGNFYIHFMNANGSVASTVKIDETTTNGPVLSDEDCYGCGLAGIGDLNGDGIPDIAVGASADDTGGLGRGAVYIHFMNMNGSIASTVKIDDNTANGPVLANSDDYGANVAGIGDLNADGIPDLAVSASNDATGGPFRGAVYIHFMNANGSIASTVKIDDSTANGPTLSDNDFYGRVAGIGDLNADGIPDLAVGAAGDDTGGTGRGAVYIHFMNANGSIASTAKIDDTTANGPVLADSDGFGRVAGIGDLNADGKPDLAVSSQNDDAGGTDRGAAYILFMNANGSIASTAKIDDTTTNGPALANDDRYGTGMAGIGDINNDGFRDIAVGAIYDDTSGTNRGAVHIHFMAPAAGTNNPTLSNRVVLSRIKVGVSATADVFFTLQNTLSGTLTITFPVGFTVTSAATGGSACLSGFAYTSSTLTATKTNCSSAISMTGATVTNPATPGTYHISWINDDPGGGDVYIVSDDQIGITASVDPVLTFNVGAQAAISACNGTFAGSGGALDLGLLSDTAVNSSDAGGVPHICARATTNGAGGATFTVKSVNAALKSTLNPAHTIPSSTATLVVGAAGYGICIGSAGGDVGSDATTPSSATPSRSAPFNGSCTASAHAVGGVTVSPQTLWTLTSTTQNAFVRIYVKAAISSSVPSHNDYNDILTFTASGSY